MSGGAKGAIVAIVVVIIVIIGLGFSGLIPGFKLGGSTSSGKSGPSYNVTFTESGLPSGSAGVLAGVSWSVTLGGSTQSSTSSTIVFSEQNGTYSYSASAAGFLPVPVSGSITVAGAAVAQTITFTALAAGTYTVTYTETGLTAGTSWSVTLNGSQLASTSTTILFTEKNGSYSFTVGSVSGYTAAPSSGTIQVAGAAAFQTITFTSSGGGGGGGQVSESQALPVAQSKANSLGAGWLAIYGAGASFLQSWSNSSTPELNSSCMFSGGSNAWPSIPAWTGDYSNGKQTIWVFFFYQSSPSPALLVIYVLSGTATSLGTITGSDCVSPIYQNETGLSGIIDSTAAATALSANDSAYLAANPSASSEFVGAGGGYYSYGSYNFSFSPTWYVYFTTCGPSGTGTANNFTAIVNGSSGVVEYSNSTTGGACEPGDFGSLQSGAGHANSIAGAFAAKVLLRGD
jgi:hypothetical protein